MAIINPHTTRAAGTVLSAAIYNADHENHITNAQALNSGLFTAWEFIATIDLNNHATADFTEFDATKYDAYMFMLANVIPATDDVMLEIRTSTDGGSNYDAGAADYQYGVQSVGGANGTSVSGAGDSFIKLTRTSGAGNGIGNAAGEEGWSGVVHVLGPHLAKNTQIIADGCYPIAADGQMNRVMCGGVRLSAADVDAIQFRASSGNLASGTITMCGLKNA